RVRWRRSDDRLRPAVRGRIPAGPGRGTVGYAGNERRFEAGTLPVRRDVPISGDADLGLMGVCCHARSSDETADRGRVRCASRTVGWYQRGTSPWGGDSDADTKESARFDPSPDRVPSAGRGPLPQPRLGNDWLRG